LRLDLEESDIDRIADRVLKKLIPILNQPDNGQSPSEPYMDMGQLCEYLRVKSSWVYSRVHSNSIPHYKAGNKLLFRRSEVDESLIAHNAS
jgi:excisionase family DNA binding protein|tara:strand:+ start:142 stop:414 length:273 start_codon:yes stop_codon:yes gene_type:complete